MKTLLHRLTLAFLIISAFSCSKEDQIENTGHDLNTASIDERMSLASLPGEDTDFILGINGHPLNSNPYIKTTAEKQIELIKSMGLSYYRFDITTMSDGGITVPYLFNPLKDAALAGNIKLLPVLYPRTLNLYTDTANSYQLGKTLGGNFAEKYGQFFEYYELGKELENKFIIAGKSGTSTTHYDLKKYRVVASYLKGMDEGIKLKDPGAKTLINATWVHYGYLQLLEQSRVKFDIVSWHWYSNQETLAAKSPYNIPDIGAKLSSMFNKPIWFTELRKKHEEAGSAELNQDLFLKNFIAKCKTNANVKAVLIYELFDEPEKGISEGNYGLLKWTSRYTSWQYKVAGNNLLIPEVIGELPVQDSVTIPGPVLPDPIVVIPPVIPVPNTRTDFMLGINGHPLGTAPYTNTPATTQIQLLKDMGMNIYRIDVMSMSDGGITVPKLFNPLKAAADAGGVKLLPMLYSRTLSYSVNESTSYNNGKILGSNFAEKYGDYFEYYELANELELKFTLPNKSGELPEHYDLAKFKIAAAYLKGMNDGVKSKDPNAKTMVNGSWLHFAYVKMLEQYGVKFDIVAWHWYSEMEAVAAKSPYNIPDIGVKLTNIFNKPIWFTETNIRYKNIVGIEQTRDNFLKGFITKCRNNPNVGSVMIYELFDEPEKSTLEGNYGIIKWTTRYTNWQLKSAANSLHN